METYREERQRLEQQAEDASLGYATELRDWLRANPIGTFKDYLIHTRRAPMTPEYNEQATARHIGNLRKQDRAVEKALEEKEAARLAEYEPFAGPYADGTELDGRTALANEQGLLSCALLSPAAIPAVRAVENEFADPFHAQVAGAILDLSDDGAPHDAAAVTDLLRARGVLPIQLDPRVPMRTVDPTQYGLGAWESSALPPQAAPGFAMEIRTAYRARYLEELCVRGAALARGLTQVEGGLGGIDLVGEARTRVANELIAFPPELGPDLKPAQSPSSSQAVDTATPIRQATALRTRDPHLPPRPQLSQQGAALLSHSGI